MSYRQGLKQCKNVRLSAKYKTSQIILDEYLADTLLETVQKVQWPYKTNVLQLQQRDQALVSFLILTGVRNSETQKIRKKQTRIYKTHILVANIETVKRGNLREKVILPKQGDLAPFTKIFEDWLPKYHMMRQYCFLLQTLMDRLTGVNH
jgi:integrase